MLHDQFEFIRNEANNNRTKRRKKTLKGRRELPLFCEEKKNIEMKNCCCCSLTFTLIWYVNWLWIICLRTFFFVRSYRATYHRLVREFKTFSLEIKNMIQMGENANKKMMRKICKRTLESKRRAKRIQQNKKNDLFFFQRVLKKFFVLFFVFVRLFKNKTAKLTDVNHYTLLQ